LPREGRGRWQEKERKERKQKERERERERGERKGESRGSWSQKRGRMERTNTRRETCARVFVREGDGGGGTTGRDATDAFHGCMPCVLDFASGCAPFLRE